MRTGGGGMKQKTKIVKCSLAPQWNEEFKWQLPASTNPKVREVGKREIKRG